MSLTPTKAQQEVLDKVSAFLDSDDDIFILHGYAGTGKTTLIKWICDQLLVTKFPIPSSNADSMRKTYYVLAPTGRAAKVLRTKRIEAGTIHSLIYSNEIVCMEIENTDVSKKRHEYVFPLHTTPKDTRAIIIDESSMIGDNVTHNEVLKFGSGRLLTDLLLYKSVSLNNTTKLSDLSKSDALDSKIKEYYSSIDGYRGCKIIFVGDDAQLPPVGDSFSRAMKAEYLRSLGLRVQETFLTEVLRQGENSGILSVATTIREELAKEKRSQLRIEGNGNDIEEIKSIDIVEHYVTNHPQPEIGDSIVVCYTNKQCYQTNMSIRERYYPHLVGVKKDDELFKNCIDIQIGDILLNNKNTRVKEIDFVYNGDMGVVTNVGKRVSRTNIPVTINEKKRHIDLHFREVDILFPDSGITVSTYLIENLLFSPERELSVWEIRALYIDFCIRMSKSHPNIKEGSEEFKKILGVDPFMTALQMKFGYAITCHKAQGGEWDSVTVDYSGRIGLNNDCLRWCYTATTRARNSLFVVNPPKINGLSSLSFASVTKISKPPKCFFSKVTESDTLQTPFHSSNDAVGTKLKYIGVAERCKAEGFSIDNIIKHNYQDVYVLSKEGAALKPISLGYDKEGVFRLATPPDNEAATQQAVKILNEALYLPEMSSYSPSSETLCLLYQLVNSGCKQLGITITNIIEEINQYKVIYNLKTEARFASIVFYITNDRLTKAMPSSEQGEDDKLLQKLIEYISENFNA